MKAEWLETGPRGVCTVMRPLVAPGGSFAVIVWLESTVNDVAVPFTVTAVVPVNPCPSSTIDVPGEPLAGRNVARSALTTVVVCGVVSVIVEIGSDRTAPNPPTAPHAP